MDPALSDYRKAAYYVTFDVTDYLKRGRNAMGVMLGNGRFFAPRLHTPMRHGPLRVSQSPAADWRFAYADGTTEVIVSDATWKITDAGPIRANSEYDGEVYDARMEMPGWNAVGVR
jgi:alpha-L-rhamnosidase